MARFIGSCANIVLCQRIKNKRCTDGCHHYAIFTPCGNDDIVVSGTNCEQIKHPSKHAEIDVMNKFFKKRNVPRTVDLYVMRISKSGSFGSSRPCLHCMVKLILSNINIRYVYYTNTNEELYREPFQFMMSTTSFISSGTRHWKFIV
jgi:tRNA(Arg) A34 adenosine deaminase TadA